MSAHQRTQLKIGVVVIVAALGLLTGCGSDSSAKKASGKPLQILFVAPLTGVLGQTGVAYERGIKAHIEYLNDQGGLHGRRVELTVKDDQSDPTRAVTLAQQSLDSNKKPDFVISGAGSSESLSLAPLLSRYKTVSMTGASSSLLDDVKKYPYFFSESALQEDILKSAANFISEKGGVKRVALVVPDDALGDATHDFFSSVFGSKKISTKTFRFQADGIDLSAAYQNAKSWSPDWIYTEGAGGQVAHMLAGRVKASAESIPTVLGVTASAAKLESMAQGSNMDNLYAALLPTQAYIPPAKRGKQFNEMFKRVTAQGKLQSLLFLYSVGWDTVGLWSTAVQNVKGKIDGDSVKKALENLPPSKDPQFPLYSGSYSASSHFHHGHLEDFTFAQIDGVKDGMRVVKAQ